MPPRKWRRSILAFGSGLVWGGDFGPAGPGALEAPEPPLWPKGQKPPLDPPMPPVPPKLNTHAATTRPISNPPRIRLVRSSGAGRFLKATGLVRILTNQPVP